MLKDIKIENLGVLGIVYVPGNRLRVISVDQTARESICKNLSGQIENFVLGKEIIDYKYDYKPDADQLVKIKEFRDTDIIADYIQDNSYLERFNEELLSNLRALCFYDIKSPDAIVIQSYNAVNIINKKTKIFLDNDTFKHFDKPFIVIKNKISGILKDGNLFFNSFYDMKRIFNMSEYIIEATEEDLISFIEHDIFSCSPETGSLINKPSSYTKMKVKSIQLSGVLNRYTPKQLQEIAKNMSIDLKLDESSKIILPPTRNEFSQILKFLDDDIYWGSLNKDKLYTSNSKRKTEKKLNYKI